MEYSDADPSFRARFIVPKFDPDSFIQSIASKSIGSEDLVNMKRRMYLISSEAKTDLKQNVYRNHTKFIETAKQVASLESEVYQLQSLLADEKQLLNTVKESLNIQTQSDTSGTLETDSCQSLLRHCQSLGLVSANPDRRVIYTGKLLEVKTDNHSNNQHLINDTTMKQSSSHVTQPCYGLLCTDCFIIAKSSNIRTATAYDVDQVIKLQRNSINTNDNDAYKQYSSTSVEIINVKDDVLRNAFSIKYNADTITMMCESAQIKKNWIEMFESLLYTRTRRLTRVASLQTQEEEVFQEEFFTEDWITNTEENLTILLAERNLQEALLLILKGRKYAKNFLIEHKQQLLPFVDDYIKTIQEKEQDLRKIIEKEIFTISERGCSTNLLKHYYQRIQILKQLGYVPKACDLFFTIQYSLMKNTLKQTKIEELNVAFVENFANTFFTRLVDSYYEFVQIFKDQRSTFTKFIVWMSKEIEKLITILHNQQYIGTKNFTFSMRNIEILLTKADEFSAKLIDVKFIFEEQIEQLLTQIIRAQKELIIDTLRQRHRDEKWIPVTFQTRERLNQLFYEFFELGVDGQTFLESFIKEQTEDITQIDLAPSTLQFTKAYLTFSRDLFKIHYLSINHVIVEALVELIKLHLKYYERTLNKTNDNNLKNFIMKNVDFSLNYLFHHVEQMYTPKIGTSTKFLIKVYDKMDKLRNLAHS
ncbi:hypothetical protein I4U23_025796 [Adineta vaga]|nr:hypothetical protein I4U23_025796 [Adineta vaga]